MIEYIFKLPLQGARTSYTDVILTSGDVFAYRLVFTFLDNGKPYDVSGCSLVIKGKRPDGMVLTDGGVVTKDGRAYYDIKSGFYEVEGELSLEVALCTQDGGYITAHELLLNVRTGHGESNLTTQNTAPVLAQLVSKAQAAERAAYMAADVAENAKEEMRQLHANAILGKQESTVVCLDDISPLAHDVKVQVYGVDDPSAVTVTKCGKSLFDLSAYDISYTSNWNGYGTYIDIRNFVGKTLMYQRKVTCIDVPMDGLNFYTMIRFLDENKNIVSNMYGGNSIKDPSIEGISMVTFTVPKNVFYMTVGYAIFLYNGGTAKISNGMVELGGTMTEYEPYSAETYTPNKDGTLYIPSQSPVMSLYTDTYGANIECEYNRDSNKVIEKLTNAIISLGGNV